MKGLYKEAISKEVPVKGLYKEAISMEIPVKDLYKEAISKEVPGKDLYKEAISKEVPVKGLYCIWRPSQRRPYKPPPAWKKISRLCKLHLEVEGGGHVKTA